jgi:hypothetical protein
MAVEVLLWDFGDTLADETWMRRTPAACPSWSSAWRDVMHEHADDWNTGRIDEAVIFSALSAHTGMDVASIERHAAACCQSITYNPAAWRAAMGRRRPQALVSVNPDLFVERVVKLHDLARHFDAVVVSCLEGTDDKTRLCDIALERLQFDGPRSDAMLIDNRSDLVDAWVHSGGSGYHYRGDAAFQSNWPSLLE